MIVNKEALDKLSVEISTTFLECEIQRKSASCMRIFKI